MATELPPAVAQFVADVSRFTEPLQKAVEATRQFGDRTDKAALQARELGIKAAESADHAAAAMRVAEEAAARYARGEVDLAAATRAATDAAKAQARADVELAALQESVAAASKKAAGEQENLRKKTDAAAGKSFTEMGILQKLWVAAGFATGSLEPLAAGIIAVTGGLASGLASAGIGLGVFGAVAKSALATASAAATAATAAQTGYTKAVATAQSGYKIALDSASTAAKRQAALTAEQISLKKAEAAKVAATAAAYHGLSGSQVELAHQVTSAQSAWQKFVASNTAGVSRILSQGLGLLPRVFQLLQPFMAPVEHALSGIVSSLARAIAPAQSFSRSMQLVAAHAGVKLNPQGAGGLAQFLHVMAAQAGPSITKIFTAVGHLGGGIAHLLELFAPFAQVVLSGLDQMTAGFGKWAAGLGKTQGFASFMTMVHTQGPVIVGVLRNLGTVAAQFIKDMSGSASNMLWLKAVPAITAFAAAFMKAHSGMVEFAMNALLVTSTGKQMFGAIGKGWSALAGGYGTVTAAVRNVRNLAGGFGDAAKAADEATGSWGTAGGKLKSIVTGVPFKNFASGFKDADAAAGEATGTMGTFGGKVSTMFAAIGAAGSGALTWIKGVPGMIGGAASAVGSFAAATVGNMGRAIAATGAWIAEHAVAAAAFVAENTVMIVSATAAFIAENAATLGIVAGIALLVAGIIYLATHWKQVWHDICSIVDAAVSFVKSHWQLIVAILTGTELLLVIKDNWSKIEHFVMSAVDSVISFVRAHWKLIVSIITGPLAAVIILVASHWREIEGAFSRGVSAVISFLRQLPGRILSVFSDAGTLLVNVGRSIAEGLIHGIESMGGSLISAGEHMGSSLWHAAASAVGFGSPAKRFIEIGKMITAGLSLGISTTAQQAVDESRRLAREVTAAAAAGQITASQEASLRKKISAALATALKGGVQDALASGTAAQIGAAHIKLLKAIWDAADAGQISRPKASALAAWVKQDNTRLQALARQRNKIAAEIAAAKAYASSTASSAEGTYSLTAAAGTGTAPASVKSIISTLQGDVGKIRRFATNIKKLAKEGLNKAYLSQVIAMGPDQGGPLAAELAAAGLGQIRAINAAESQVTAASNGLGNAAANAMYDSGKAAGKGFLSGLKAQEAAIDKVMAQIAANLVKRLRKDLGISSPSKVFFAHGQAVAQGLALGILSGAAKVGQAVRGLSAAASLAGTGSAVPAGVLSAAGSRPVVITVNSRIEGKLDNQVVWRAQQQETLRYNIRNSGQVTGAVKPGAA